MLQPDINACATLTTSLTSLSNLDNSIILSSISHSSTLYGIRSKSLKRAIASFTATSTNSNPSFTSHYQDYDAALNASIEGAAGQAVGGNAFASVSGATVSSNTFKAGLDLIAKLVNGGAN